MGVIQSINNVRLFDFYGAAPGGVVFIDTFDTPALLPEWTTLLGTPANNAGALQATATADDAYNLALNAEWTVDTSNWTAGGGGVLSRVDSSLDPGTDSTTAGAADKWAGKLVNGGGRADATGVALISGLYSASCLAYVPSANAQVNAAQLSWGGAGTIAAEDAWLTITRGAVPTSSPSTLRLQVAGANPGDIAYYDTLSWVMQWAGLTHDAGTPDVQITAGMMTPGGVSVSGRAILVRVTDDQNLWAVVLQPNTAGLDTFICERVAGVWTQRASADVDWTAAASTDWVRVTTMGPSIAVQYCKAGETAWSHACAYTGMATGNSATLHGLGLLVSATDSFAYYEEVPL